MTPILIRHKVSDYSNWKTEFDAFAETRKSGGEQSYRILRPSDDPNDLILFFEWDTTERALTFLQSPELKSAMERAGVTEEPRIEILDQVDFGSV